MLGAISSNAKRIDDDSITSPLLKENGKYKKITWKEAYDLMDEKASSALKNSGVNGVALFTNANISVEEAYALNKLFKAGFRSNNISTNSYNNEEIHLKARTIVYGIDGVSGSFNDLLNSNYILQFDTINTNTQINKNLKFVNITTNNHLSKEAFINLKINKNTYHLLLSYIINEYIKQIDEKDQIYIKKHFVFANFKDNTQWEISQNNYKIAFEKYTLDYVSSRLKQDSKEDINIFKENLLKIKNIFLDDKTKIISLTSKIFNRSINSLQTSLLLQTLHLLVNKHSRPGCGAFNISSYLSQDSLDGVGLYSNRLASNMYIKYKQHRKKAEKTYSIIKGTLNPISYTHEEFINNINTDVTKFLWLCSDENEELFEQITNDKLFTVQSTSSINNINKNATLILPLVKNSEKNSIYISEDKEIRYSIQKDIPNGLSMSLLWQVLEFSQRFNINQVYKKSKVDDKYALKSVIKGYKRLGYNNDSTLFDILFDNSKLRLFPKDYGLNSEMNSDNRNIIGSDGGIFIGYRYNIQEYLFNEYRQFSLLNGHDLPRYKEILDSNTQIFWPYYDSKSVLYRFNPLDDPYAKKSLKDQREYSFYGKMGEKNLPFGDLQEITNEKDNKKTFKYRAKLFTCNYNIEE